MWNLHDTRYGLGIATPMQAKRGMPQAPSTPPPVSPASGHKLGNYVPEITNTTRVLIHIRLKKSETYYREPGSIL